MISESDKKAIAKYHREKTKPYSVRFLSSKDADIIAYLDDHPNKISIFREAIRMYMEKETLTNT